MATTKVWRDTVAVRAEDVYALDAALRASRRVWRTTCVGNVAWTVGGPTNEAVSAAVLRLEAAAVLRRRGLRAVAWCALLGATLAAFSYATGHRGVGRAALVAFAPAAALAAWGLCWTALEAAKAFAAWGKERARDAREAWRQDARTLRAYWGTRRGAKRGP